MQIGSTVELGREENRGVLQDFVGASELPVLLLEIAHPPTLVGRETGLGALVDLRPATELRMVSAVMPSF